LRNNPPPPSDKFEIAADGKIIETEPEVAAQPLVTKEEAVVTEPSAAAVGPIMDAGNQAAAAAIASEQVTPADAAVKKTEAENLVALLTQEVESEEDFEKLLAAIGPSEIDYSQWKSQAKELLGIDKEEADVPDWAAPMFMFGLKLMQGPVTGKTEGRSLLGGFLGDVGAAGAAAFPLLAAERARKSKQRAAIATVTMQLEGADASRKKLILDAYESKQASALRLSETVSNSFNKLTNRVMNLVPDDQEEKRVTGMFAIDTMLNDLKGAGVSDTQLLLPQVQSLISTYAANQMGITKTPMKLSNQEIGGVKYAWDPKALEAARTKYNKAHPDAQIPTTIGFLSKLIAKDTSVQEYQSLLIGTRAVNTESKIRGYVNKIGEKVEDEILVNVTKRNEWMSKNPDATQTQIIKAQPTWQFVTETRLQSTPSFTERQFVAENGETVKYYINDAAFAAHKRSDKKLTMQKVVNNPDNYPKILGGTIKDYSKLQPNLENILIYENGMKRTFVLDKNAVGRALEKGDIKAGEGLEKIVSLGLGRYLGEGTAAGQNERITTISIVDGVPTIKTIEAKDAKGVMTAFDTKQEAAKWRGRGNSLVTLNTTLWEINKVIEERGLGVTTQLTDFAGSALVIADIVNQTFDVTNAQAKAALSHADLTDETRGSVGKAFGEDIWDKIIEDKEQRGAIKSMFINLAFALASSREGGKLTDNDVKNALETLGWDGSAWTQTPGQIMARMKVAARTANDQYIIDNLGRMSEPDKEAYLKTQDENKPDMVELLLRDRARAIKGAMQDRFQTSVPKGEEPLFLRYDRKADPVGGRGAEGRDKRPFISVETSFESGITNQMNTGTFTEGLRTIRIPNQFRVIHNEVFTPGGKYSVVESPMDFSNRLKVAAARLKQLDSSLTDQEIANQINAYKNFFQEQELFRPIE
jgi:hypothetical protein